MSTPEDPEIKDTPQKEAMEEEGTVHNDFKDTDIDLKTVKKFVIGSFAVTLAMFVLMLMVHKFYRNSFSGERGTADPAERQIPSSEGVALLQTVPLEDLHAYQDGETEKLNMTTNATDHAVIPVEEAKKLMLAEQAFPTPAPKTESETSGELSPMVQPMTASTPPSPTAAAKPAETASTGGSGKMVPKYSEPVDPAMASAGKVLWTQHCTVCHTGKPGAIGPNIEKAFGTMRKLENHDPILMDTEYVINSMNNPAEHVAKGYMPVMTPFTSLPEKEKQQIAAYLRSQGKEIMVAAPESEASEAATAAETAPAPLPAATPAPAAQEPAPAAPAPTPAPAAPAAPAAPTPAPTAAPSGAIFV